MAKFDRAKGPDGAKNRPGFPAGRGPQQDEDTRIAGQVARSGVVRPQSVAALQHTIGNRQVQRLISVQRNPLQLEESDIQPELLEDLDQKFQLTDQEGARQEGPAPEEEQPGPRAKDQRSYFSRLATKLMRKRGRAREKGRTGVGWRALAETSALVGSTVDAWSKGGIHSHLTKRNRRLDSAKRLIKQGKTGQARGLMGGKPILQDASTGRMLKIALTSPILFARLAAENSKAKKLWEKLKAATEQ